MTVKLDDLDLVAYVGDDVQGTVKQVRTITNLKVKYDRRMFNAKIASADSVLRDAGRHAVTIFVSGIFFGEDALQGLKVLQDKHRAGEPLQFVSDLTLLAQVKNVLIEGLAISATSGKKHSYLYEIILHEYNEPPAEEKAPSQEQGVQEDTKKEAALEDIAVEVVTPEGEVVKNAKVLIKGPDREIHSETDENGLVEILDAPEGKYEITVEDDERFKDIKKEIEIKKDKG
jgi:hypothetical protein